MPRTRMLQLGPINRRFDAWLAQHHDVTAFWEQPDREAWLAAHGAEIDLVVTSGIYGLTAAQIARMPRLRAVCSFGVGFDTLDLAAARARGIVVSNTPGVLDDCVADLAMGLLIDAARRVSHGDRFVRAGAWARRERFGVGSRVSRKKLGIVGLGRIGGTVARRAGGFDLTIRYHNRHPVDGCAYGYEPSLVELARWADFLIVTVVGGAGTVKLIDAAVLDALGPAGVLVNVARGSVVDEDALVAALRDGRLGAAGLDVYEHEPQVHAGLLAQDNCVLSPHLGSATHETRADMEALLRDNIARFLEHGELVTPVT